MNILQTLNTYSQIAFQKFYPVTFLPAMYESAHFITHLSEMKRETKEKVKDPTGLTVSDMQNLRVPGY